MRILMVTDALEMGGKERRMLELIKGLVKHQDDFEVCLLSLSGKIEYKYVYDLPIKFEILNRRFSKDISIVFKLRKRIAAFSPDLIHSWGTMSGVYLAAANLFSGIPVVSGVLADAYAGLNIFDKHYFRVKLITPFSDVFISNSMAGIKAYRTPVDKTVCIYNGVDFGRFENLRPQEEVEIEILGSRKNNRFVMAMVAGFDDRKDFETLVNAAVRICSIRKELVFLLIGDGPLRKGLMSKVPESLLGTQLIFTGKRSDIESVLQIVDVGLLITFYEGISNSIIEYMAMGKPAIATIGGGTAELVKDNVNGFLVDARDENQIIQKIELLFANRDLLDEMGKRAYVFVRQKFDIEDKLKEYIDLYRTLLKNKAKVFLF